MTKTYGITILQYRAETFRKYMLDGIKNKFFFLSGVFLILMLPTAFIYVLPQAITPGFPCYDAIQAYRNLLALCAGALTGMVIMGIYRLATTYIQLRQAIKKNDPDAWPKVPENLIRDKENLCLLEIPILRPRQLTQTVISGMDQGIMLHVKYDDNHGMAHGHEVNAGKFTVLAGPAASYWTKSLTDKGGISS